MPRAARLVVCGATCALLSIAATVGAQPRAGAGPVRVAVGALHGARTEALGHALREALDRTPDVRLTSAAHAQLVLRGSVQRLEREVVDGRATVRCEVSVIVANARGGAIVAVLSGRAGAQGEDGPRLRDNALRAAVRGALRPLRTSGRALARGAHF